MENLSQNPSSQNPSSQDTPSQDTPFQGKVEEMLRQRIGLNPKSVGSRSIMRAVKRGMRSGKMQGLSDYVKELQDNPELFSALVESVVVPETSFFRNRASFVFLRQWVAQRWLKRRNDSQPIGEAKEAADSACRRESSASAASKVSGEASDRALRILSVPCSTGEEPYSIAITLREEGLSLNDFHIDAVDISEQAIAKAKKGVYSPYAFRRHSYREDDKYFTLNTITSNSAAQSQRRVVQRYVLNDDIRNQVTFTCGNLLEPGLLARQRPYDVIFCRNLLIYFDKPARDRALNFLYRMLKPGGLLFLGYAETGLIDKQQYKPVPYPQTFAYYRREEPLKPTEDEASAPLPQFAQTAQTAQFAQTAQTAQADALTQSSEKMPQSLSQHASAQSGRSAAATELDAEIPSLSTAQQLADSGNISRAIALCETYLQHSPADANAYLLRGELHLITDELAAAESCFEKAIYLNSQLVEALTHLMLIKEAQNASAEASLLKERIRRIEN